MWIERVRLTNIKSYAEQTITFTRGVNFIHGLNGAGKSTIIEAIGLALFDARTGPYGNLLRRGARSGQIEVDVCTAEGTFRAVRKIQQSGSSSWVIYEDGCELLLQGSGDVQAWLRERLGFPGSLSEHFQELVAVWQGQFVAPFLETPQVRRGRFDPLFSIDVYRTAFERSLETRRMFETDMGEARVACETERARAEGIMPAQEEHARLEVDCTQLALQVEEVAREREAAKRALEALEKAEKRLQAARQQTALGEKALEALETQRVQLQRELVAAREAVQILQETATDEQAWHAADQERQAQEKERIQRDICAAKHQGAVRRRAELAAALRERNDSLVQQQAAYAQGEAGTGSLRARAEALRMPAQKATAEAEALRKHWSERQRDYERWQAALGERAKAVETLLRGLDRRKQLMDARAQCEARLANASALEAVEKAALDGEVALGNLRARLAAAREQLRMLREQAARAGGDLCPFLGKPCGMIEGGLAAHFAREIARVQEECRALTVEEAERTAQLSAMNGDRQAYAALTEVRAQLATTVEKLAQADSWFVERLSALHQPVTEGLERLTHERPPVRDAIAPIDVQCTALAEEAHWQGAMGEQQRQELRTAQETQRALDLAAAEATSTLRAAESALEMHLKAREETAQVIKSLAAALEGMRASLAIAMAEEETCAAALAPYETLDMRLAQTQAQLDRTAQAHARYSAHTALAAREGNLAREAEAQAEGIRISQEALAQAREVLAQAEAGFDPDALKRAQEVSTQVIQAAATLEAQLAERTTARDKLVQQIAQMQAALVRAQKAAQAMQRLKRGQQVLDFAREVLRDAGELIATQLRKHVSADAESLYAQISGDPVTLQWAKDYEVQLVDQQDGRERVRTMPQLSGGEQMTAALAVRLALLTHLSPLRFCCFDEPTAHMDATRRANLSETLPLVTQGWDQVLVISHDDTFDALSEHAVRLAKVQGETALIGL